MLKCDTHLSCYLDEDAPAWAEKNRDSIVFQFYIKPPLGTLPPPAFRKTFYVFPKSVTELAEEFRGLVEFAWGPEVMDYGMREFGIQDPKVITLPLQSLPYKTNSLLEEFLQE